MERAVDKPKVLFCYINSRSKNKEAGLVLKGENNEGINENEVEAGHLNRFFASVFTDEADFDEAGLPSGTSDKITDLQLDQINIHILEVFNRRNKDHHSDRQQLENAFKKGHDRYQRKCHRASQSRQSKDPSSNITEPADYNGEEQA
ncbi:hypothetical protein SprV_0301342700 [Sparganum proliferum]